LAAAEPVGPAELDDRPEPFTPLKKPTEHAVNHQEALALFAAGRMEEQRGNLPGALRYYQRALRLDPRALPVVRQIIEVTHNLDRVSEYLRYAQLAVELDPSDQRLVVALADQLTNDGKFAEALKLYQLARSRPDVNKKKADYIVMTLRAGIIALQLERPKEAADAFVEVMEALDAPKEYGLDAAQRKTLLGKDGQMYAVFGDAFLSADRADRALEAFEKADKLAPNKATAAFFRARVKAHQKAYDEAIAQLQIYFDAHANDREEAPYELLKKILTDTGRSGDLIPRLEKLQLADPENVHLRAFLAEEYLAAKQFALAEPLFQELLKKSPQVDAYRAGLVDVYRQTKKADGIIKLLGDAVDKSGSLASVASQVKAIVSDAALMDSLFEAARARQKASPGLSYSENLALAQTFLEGKRYEPAGEFYDAVLNTKPKNAAEILLNWGLGLLSADQHAAAVKVLQRGIDEKLLPKGNPTLHNYLAIALEFDGKTEAALEAARAAAKMGEKSARLESRIAWIYYHAKRYDEATRHYRELIERHDSDYRSDDVRRVLREARLTLSNIAVVQHAIPQAEEWLEQVLDEFPDDVSASNDLGYLWADEGKNLERALKMVQLAVAAEPENGAYRDSLGWALYRLGRYDEALVELKKAAAEPDPDGVILDHLGDIYLALKQIGPARETWQRAIASLKKQNDKDKIGQIEEKLKKHSQ
jgi:tetratricopeptide (TPR) repeat protein